MKNTYRIAIMTWHTYQNYGSILQASALYHIIESMGYNSSFVNYLPKGQITKTNIHGLTERCFNKIKSLGNPAYISDKQSKLFTDYLEQRVSYSSPCTSYPELYDLNQQYDAFVCGSDQIWSPLCYDSKYFLDFVADTEKMVAYAPSIGSTKIENAIIRKKMAENISRFKYLAVREQQGADLIKELTGQDAKVVLDPTLLMNASQWDSYAETEKVQKITDEKYMLCYFLGESEKYMDYVRILAKRMNLPFYVIPVTIRQKQSGNTVPFEVGPKEFVSLIRNASYVCTDSFHGMAFSVNYNIPFSVFKRFQDNDPKNQNSRIFNLLKLLKLEERLTDYQKKYAKQLAWNCDFSKANACLEELRKDSFKYLEQALYAAVSKEKGHVRNCSEVYKITDMCCGCGACAAVCTKEAVSIEKNSEGFAHYTIDTEKCVRCGQCQSVCPMIKIEAPHMKQSKALYALKSHSEAVLKVSSSGGVGYEFAAALLAKDYAVCGCTYDISDNSARHIWVFPGETEKLGLLQGSKYIQSLSADALGQIVEIIKKQRVVFFGTPCQAAAVDKLLRKKGLRDRAMIVDLICHGVPSYYLWDRYLKDIDKKCNTGEHPKVLFRSKEREWRRLLLLVSGNGHTYKKEEQQDDFYAFFRRGLCYMEACSDCPYRERSAADIRIGDYWGNRFKNDKQGVSMVIANTAWGDILLKEFQQNGSCRVEAHDLSEYWSVQYPYNPQRPLIREELIEELKSEKESLHVLRKKYCTYYDLSESLLKFVYTIKSIVKGK